MSQQHELRILLADNQAGSTNPIAIAARNCDLIGDQTFGSDPGRRGSRQNFACGARVLKEEVTGGFNFYPTALQLDWLIQRMIGNSIATFPDAACTPLETLPPIYAFVDKGHQNFRYDLLHINTVKFSIREGDYVDVRVDFIGSSETQAVSWPATPPNIDCASEFVASDTVLDLAGTAYPFKTVDFTIENAIAAQQHENALVRSIFESEDFRTYIDATLGFRSDTVALYRQGVAGGAAFLRFADGTRTYTFTFANAKIPGRGPTVPDSGEITMNLRIDLMATQSGATVTPQVSIAKL